MRGSSACSPPATRAKTSKSLSETSAKGIAARPHLWGGGLKGRRGGRGLALGVLLGLLTFAFYMIGSNRSFGYDAAATFANFVATPSIWDAFAVRSVIPTIPVTQVATNDHVLLSLVSHLIYSATGSRSEVVYRLIPALAAGATVGVSTSVLTRRFGVLAGVCAGLYIATDPLFVDNSRDLRGYSLAALGSVVATLLLPIQGEGSGEAGQTGRLVAYAVIMGLAISAQLFAGVVLLLHISWILTRRSKHEVLQLAPAWIAALVIGVTANATIQVTELTQHGLPPQMFNPTFPSDTV